MYQNLLPLLLLLALTGTVRAQDKSPYATREILNLPYVADGEELQQLNLVLPQGTDSLPPLLLWLGGGAWAFVDKDQEMPLARLIAAEGIAVASVGHRLSSGAWRDPDLPQTGAQHPAHIEDAAAAFHWLRTHAAEHGYDPARIFVGGYSCGAHLAALLGSDPRYLAEYGYELADIRGLFPIAGAYDIPHYHEFFATHEDPDTRRLAELHVEGVFGSDPAVWREASPSEYLDQVVAPMLLVSDGALFPYTQVYEARIRASSYRKATIYHVLDLNHGQLWRDLAHNARSRHRSVLVDFILTS